jgi:hypothetical protein
MTTSYLWCSEHSSGLVRFSSGALFVRVVDAPPCQDLEESDYILYDLAGVLS